MPEIIVSAADWAGGAVMLRERVTASDFESAHFAAQLVQRVGWAVGDAHDAEQAHRAERGVGAPGERPRSDIRPPLSWA